MSRPRKKRGGGDTHDAWPPKVWAFAWRQTTTRPPRATATRYLADGRDWLDLWQGNAAPPSAATACQAIATFDTQQNCVSPRL